MIITSCILLCSRSYCRTVDRHLLSYHHVHTLFAMHHVQSWRFLCCRHGTCFVFETFKLYVDNQNFFALVQEWHLRVVSFCRIAPIVVDAILRVDLPVKVETRPVCMNKAWSGPTSRCASASYAATEALYYVYALRVPASVPRHRYFFRFARILNGFRWNLPEVVTSHYTANRLNIYILGEIGAGTKEQDTTEYSNRRQSVLPRYQTGGDA